MSKKHYKKMAKGNQKTNRIAYKIIEFYLKYPNKPLNHKQLSSGLHFTTRKQKDDLIKAVSQLAQKNQIVEVSPGKFKLNIQDNTEVGIIDFTSSGSAYVLVEGYDNDIFIPQGKTKNALEGDLVQLLITPKKGGKTEGSILKVVQRSKTRYVGVLDMAEGGKYGFVIVDNNAIHVDIYIPKEKLNNAEDGDKVVVDIVDWPEDTDSPFGKVVQVLGKPGEHEVEIHAILAEYGLPYDFPPEVEQEAQDLDTSIQPDEIKRRRDMRDITTFTIDPADAKDFDDALSIQKLENGNWEIGVHIADVSHYVKPGTLLDEEAYNRATSVYLVDRVVPMLPEVLSNFACSLRPNEEKYTFSAVFEINDEAKVLKSWFGRTVIYSDKRFAYEEAQEIIEGKEDPLKDEIQTLDRLAKILRDKRLQNGAIAFDKLEVKFNLNEENEPVGVYFKESKDANHLIEEFMLLANRKVAEFVGYNAKTDEPTNKTFIYRIHDDPNPDKLQSLKIFVKQFGYSIELDGRKKITSSLNKLLKDVHGKGEENVIETLTMRTMSKAIYSTDNIGHYGLAFDYYSHFTSPIRRYPDVIAHRLLQHYLDKKKSPKSDPYEDNCLHCSERERLAADAERDSIKYMQVKYMENYLDQEMYGVISGVTEWGIYVEIPETRAEGLIRLRSIPGDHYEFDEKNYAIVGQRTKKIYQLGDTVRVKLIEADLKKKQLDFELLG